MDEQKANQELHQQRATSLKASLKAEREAEDAKTTAEITEEHIFTGNISSPPSVAKNSDEQIIGENDLTVLCKVAQAVNKLQITDDTPDKNSPQKISRISMDFLVETADLDGVFADAGNKEKFAERLLRTVSKETTNSAGTSTSIMNDMDTDDKKYLGVNEVTSGVQVSPTISSVKTNSNEVNDDEIMTTESERTNML